MVQMKKILENFVTNRYKQVSRKPYSAISFSTGIFGYLALFSFVLLSIWGGGAGEISNNFLGLLRYPLVFMIILNILGYFIFRIAKLKKYAAIISYFSGVLFLLFTWFFIACLSDNPIKYSLYGSFLISMGWMIGIIIHVMLVSASLKKGSMKIRDNYGDYYVNAISIISLLFIFYFSISDRERFLLISVALIIVALLVSLTFSFPRILPYWRKEVPKKDVSVYGNTTKMMKRGKSK